MKKIIIKSSNEQVINKNTDLCMDVKTILRSDRVAKIGKDYQGMLTRDSEDHYSFIETVQTRVEKRNPQIYRGEFVTVTRMEDGTYHPNLRPMKVGEGFNVEHYASGVANELLWALDGLVED